MPDPQTLYAIAAIIGAAAPTIIAITGLVGELRRGWRPRHDHPSDQDPPK
ncbi:hypothetical protein ACLBXB_14355 [Methylobacterium mesophilicum]